ncbi:MAG: hypothetical protein HY908_37430 [Myxococcales bacterium]|nr:hypothetical protein [Myxococcales bacterium]
MTAFTPALALAGDDMGMTIYFGCQWSFAGVSLLGGLVTAGGTGGHLSDGEAVSGWRTGAWVFGTLNAVAFAWSAALPIAVGGRGDTYDFIAVDASLMGATAAVATTDFVLAAFAADAPETALTFRFAPGLLRDLAGRDVPLFGVAGRLP